MTAPTRTPWTQQILCQKKKEPLLVLFSIAESEGFEGTDIAYGNPTSKTLMPASGIQGKAASEGFEPLELLHMHYQFLTLVFD